MIHPLSIRSHRGQVILLALVFAGIFMMVGTALVALTTTYGRAERVAVAAAQALALAEGALEKSVYELNNNPSYTGETATPLGPGTFTVVVTPIDTVTKQVTATGYVPDSVTPLATKTIRADVGIGDDRISFHYGIQAGEGGFSLANSSSITGNAYSNGPVVGAGGNYIRGSVVSAGPSGIIYGVHATGTAYAHTIGTGQNLDTEIDGDAYYVTKVNTTVHGTLHPGSADLPPAELPISDEQIAEWEAYAESGGTITSCNAQGDYEISSNVSLGPKKIACNLIVKTTSGVLTMTGPIWVTGNITFQTGPTIRIDPALGSENVALIADNPANQTGSGRIIVGQSTVFQNSGAENSFVFLISQNKSAEQGGSTIAIDLSQGASAMVAYARHGLVALSQSVSVNEATGYKIALSQSANVVYSTGLPSTVFDSGPGGSWSFIPGTYAITR